MAGKTLLRFWQVALQVDAQEQVQGFKTEVEFIASALGQIGQRVFLASKLCHIMPVWLETDLRVQRGTAYCYRASRTRCAARVYTDYDFFFDHARQSVVCAL